MGDVVQSSPSGLELMYSRLLEFVPHHCRLLREVTGGAVSRYWFCYWCFWEPLLWDSRLLCRLSDRADAVPGYDFLVNSVWPEMIRAIEERLPQLFSPGNPDVFYAVGPSQTPIMHLSARLRLTCGSFAEVQRQHGVCAQL